MNVWAFIFGVIGLASASHAQQCNYALRFDGAQDFVEMAGTPPLPGAAHTIECWVRANPGTVSGAIAGQHTGDAIGNCYQGYVLTRGDGSWVYTTNTDGCDNGRPIFAPSADTNWHHLAGTYDGFTQIIYLDGTEVARRVGAFNPGGRFSLGAQFSFYYSHYEAFFAGDVDEVRMWSVARSAGSIAASRYSSLAGDEAGLVGYWPLNEGVGQFGQDTTVSARHGRLGATPGAEPSDPVWIAALDLTAPASITTCVQAPAAFQVHAIPPSEHAPSFQWQKLNGEGVFEVVQDGVLPGIGVLAGVTTSTLTVTQCVPGAAAQFRCVATNSCASVASDAAALTVSQCDCIDYNNDSVEPDTADIDDFLSVFSGGGCSTTPPAGTGCNDIDFNNDGLFPDTLDIDSLLSVFSGGACL